MFVLLTFFLYLVLLGTGAQVPFFVEKNETPRISSLCIGLVYTSNIYVIL